MTLSAPPIFSACLDVAESSSEVLEPLRTHLSNVLPETFDVAIERIPRGRTASLEMTEAGAAASCHWTFELRCGDGVKLRLRFANDDLPDPLAAAAAVRSAVEWFACRRRIDESDVMLEAYARQMTISFEELAWLRLLSEKFQSCTIDNELPALVGELLPTMQQLLRADEIYFLPTAAADAAASVATAETHVQPSAQLSRNERIERLQAYCDEVGQSLVIKNASSDARFREMFQDVYSVMSAKLSVDGRSFGRLIAARKYPEGLDWKTAATATIAQLEQEFGTFEGSLLRSATTMLTTHGVNVDLLREQRALLVGTVRSLINSIDAKDSYTCGHSDRVASIARRIAVQIGLPEEVCEDIFMTGLLHDIGKIGVPDAALKKPGKLTDEEFEQIKKHPTIGYNIIKHIKPLAYTLDGILHHHERYDGRGYPGNLAGDTIPLHGRILAVADAYDAMTSCRPYRTAMPTERAEGILRDGSGIQWDPSLITAFFDAIDDIRGLVQPPQPIEPEPAHELTGAV